MALHFAGPTDTMTPAASARYLLERSLLSPSAVVDLGLTVDDVSMSHRAYLVCLGGKPKFFVKRADALSTGGRHLQREIDVYRLATRYPALASVLPKCHYLDDAAGILVLEPIGGGTIGAHVHPGDSPDPATTRLLSAYGEALGRVHHVRPAPMGEPPWLLGALEPIWGNYDWLPAPCASVLRRVAANPVMRLGFRNARSRWNPVALVHGDLRWANIMLVGSPWDARVVLVDWELACLGDPTWDLGCALADLVTLLALHGDRGDNPERLAVWAAPLLMAYLHELGSRESRRGEIVQLSLQMAAVRLVQSLIEWGHVQPDQMAALEPTLVGWSTRLVTDTSTASAIARALDERG